jgi:hypothetical protein
MAKIMSIGDRLKLTVSGVDGGRRAKLLERPSWEVAPALVQLEPGEDGQTCLVTAATAGDCTITARVGRLSEVYAISVLPAAATALVITAEDVKVEEALA